MSLNISDLGFLFKNCNHWKRAWVTPLSQQYPSNNWNSIEPSLFENLGGSSALPRRKGVSNWNYDQFLKNIETKTKPVVRGYIYWLESMYTISDGKAELLLHYNTNINRSDAPFWLDVSDRWSYQKGCPLLWMSLASYSSKVHVWEMKDNLLSLRKMAFLTKH